MIYLRFSFLLACLLAALPVHAEPVHAEEAQNSPTLAPANTDIPIDPSFVTGALPNGLRYIIRQNNRPESTGLVRMYIGSGSLSEKDGQEGLAHFLEHMAFNGSKKIPEGEMVKLLEREGLAFGADTNASTGFEQTLYKLDLPRNDEKLLDTALMIMRETASELTISDAAVERERGVVLAEMRDRQTFTFKNLVDRLEFLHPTARYNSRFPIGKAEVLSTATEGNIRELYEREYVPANTAIIIIGDFPPAKVQEAITRHFASWQPRPLPAKPATGPIEPKRKGKNDIYIDPALSENISVFQHKPYEKRADTAEKRRQDMLLYVAYGALNRRLSALAQSADSPFSAAALSASDFMKLSRTFELNISAEDGKWQRAMSAGVETMRTALAYGFTDAEIAEQTANVREYLENSVKGADTRRNGEFVDTAIALVADEEVPTTPAYDLQLFDALTPSITPANVLAAFKRDIPEFKKPMIRFSGRKEPVGGVAALRKHWKKLLRQKLTPPSNSASKSFAYTHFGEASAVISDVTDGALGIRQIRFKNGVRLNLKKTDLAKERISFRMGVDGGTLLNTRENPDGTAMIGYFAAGGLGKHSADELTTILAGKSVGAGLESGGDRFIAGGSTTPRDLELQLQLLTAYLTDPGYRAEGQTAYKRAIARNYKRLYATPSAAYSNSIGAILSDNDPRFSLSPEEVMKAKTYKDLAATLGTSLQKGAIEIALVGDIDEEAAIAAAARTLGALPPRENEFQKYEGNLDRAFTKDRKLRIIPHEGEKNQAVVRLIWPTDDDRDLRQFLTLSLLEGAAIDLMQEEIREKLGQAYSPGASSSQSHIYPGYGTFEVYASVDLTMVEKAREAMKKAMQTLVDSPISSDALERVRRPILERLGNALKSNAGWLTLADRAASEPDGITRFLKAKEIYQSLTPADLHKAARKFLKPEAALEVHVVPKADQPTAEMLKPIAK